MTPPTAASVEPPPSLVTAAQTHDLEVDFVRMTNRMIERLVDKHGKLTGDQRRALERTAKIRCAEIIKQAAVSCAVAINEVTLPAS